MPPNLKACFMTVYAVLQSLDQSILRDRQRKVVPQPAAGVFFAEDIAALQLRDDLVDELFERVRQERRRDDEPVAGLSLNDCLHVVGDLCGRPGDLRDEYPAAV